MSAGMLMRADLAAHIDRTKAEYVRTHAASTVILNPGRHTLGTPIRHASDYRKAELYAARLTAFEALNEVEFALQAHDSLSVPQTAGFLRAKVTSPKGAAKRPLKGPAVPVMERGTVWSLPAAGLDEDTVRDKKAVKEQTVVVEQSVKVKEESLAEQLEIRELKATKPFACRGIPAPPKKAAREPTVSDPPYLKKRQRNLRPTEPKTNPRPAIEKRRAVSEAEQIMGTKRHRIELKSRKWGPRAPRDNTFLASSTDYGTMLKHDQAQRFEPVITTSWIARQGSVKKGRDGSVPSSESGEKGRSRCIKKEPGDTPKAQTKRLKRSLSVIEIADSDSEDQDAKMPKKSKTNPSRSESSSKPLKKSSPIKPNNVRKPQQSLAPLKRMSSKKKKWENATSPYVPPPPHTPYKLWKANNLRNNGSKR